ncbi:MAG: response regulator [Spirosomataceae bacterium]
MILIVDDRPENILPLKKILELHGFQVDTAESGEEALRKVLNTNYSVIILDVQMPKMDGFEVAGAIAGFGKARDTSIIFLSAINKEKKFIAKGYTSGGVDYLTKPVDADILVLKVKTLHRLYEQQQELRAIQTSLRNEIEVRKKAQEELVNRMQELRSVLASLPQMAFTIAPGGQIEYVNEHWYHYSEHPDRFPEIHPGDSSCRNWENHFKNELEYTQEMRLRERATGDFKYHFLRITPIKQQGEIIRWVGTFTDIHERKLATEMLEQKVEKRTRELLTKNEELERTNHELHQFAWVVSHDLKEPLRKIQILNGMIKENYLKENSTAAALADRSINSSARMTQLIDDLLEYSQLSVSGSFQLTDLNRLLQEIIMDFEEAVRAKNALITVEPLPVLEVIPNRIRQVFQNLISNALKFSKKEVSPVIHIRSERINVKDIDAPSVPDGKYCRIELEDNGIGFDEKYLDRIFVIFQRLNERTSYEGTGIGLAIAKKNIERHNGLISAKSSPEKGATFIIVLPVTQTEE